jgi:hypothetical protein
MTRKDWRIVQACVLIALISAVYAWWNWEAAFPQASLDLRLSKDEITARALAVVRGRGYNPTGFRILTLFDPDDEARLYLERELGMQEANRLMAGTAPVWRWRARWFRPPEKEEFVVWLAPGGRLIGFAHEIAETAPGARPDAQSALQRAKSVIDEHSREPHRLVEQRLEEKPNRHDHVFTWEQENFRAKDATLRRTVVIQGDQAARYEEFLHIPEQWKREFMALRSRNQLYAAIAQALYVPLILAAIAVLVHELRRRAVPWRATAAVSAIVAVLMMLNGWNALPFFIDQMPTSTPYTESLMQGILQAVGSGVGVFFYVILAAAAGAPLYARAFPWLLAPRVAFSRAVLRTKEFAMACIAGYGFAAAHIAFVVAFYLIGRRFGVWSPQDVQYSDLLSTSIPWLYPLAISAMASTSEEFWFRLLAVPLLARLLGVRWAAVVIPALVWGFLHANYPQQPAYIRGIEVGAVGVAAGYLMLRFGILATLTWHYAVDATLIGLFLFQSASWSHRLGGVIVAGLVLLPLAYAVIEHRRHGGFVEPEPPAPEAPPEIPAGVETLPAADPLPPEWPVRWLWGASAVGLLAALLLYPVRFGDFIRVQRWRPEARAIANAEIERRGLDVAAWRSVTEYVPGLQVEEFEYLRQVAGREAAQQAVRDYTLHGAWRTRYFRPLQKEEWRVFVDERGRAFRLDHILDEKAPGARLTADQARARAERFLDGQGIRLRDYRLVDSHEEKRDQRSDHTFVFEHARVHWGEARPRVLVEVVGDHVSVFRRFLKLPEAWLRDFERPRLRSYLVPGAIGALVVPLLIIFIKRVTSGGHRFHWRAYWAVAVVTVIAGIVSAVNRAPTFWAGYNPAAPAENYAGQMLAGRAVMVLLLGAGALLAVLAADVFRQLATGDRRLAQPSIVRALAVVVLLFGFRQALGALEQLLPGPRSSLPLWSAPGLDSAAPAITVLAQAYAGALFGTCALVVLVAAAIRFLDPRRRIWMLLLLALIYAAGTASHPAQAAFYFTEAVAAFALAIFLVRTCGSDMGSYAAALFWAGTAGAAWTLLGQPAPALYWNGVAAAFGAAVAGIVALGLGRKAL